MKKEELNKLIKLVDMYKHRNIIYNKKMKGFDFIEEKNLTKTVFADMVRVSKIENDLTINILSSIIETEIEKRKIK